LGVRLLAPTDADFPASLREIPQSPSLMMIRGTLDRRDAYAVAIVGSRHCTDYGRRIAADLSRGLAARGVTVISGLARGIDATAHAAALGVGGRTIAVLASGLGNVYPPEHLPLAEQIAGSGALLSEAPLDGPPIGELFPKRNRIISGLARGVVVVEAAERSGALSTAFHAVEQSREVFAVPGRVSDNASAGCNALIRRGAVLVRSVDDIIEHLGPIDLPALDPRSETDSAVATPTPPNLNELEQKLWQALSVEPIDLDALLEKTGLSAAQASSTLLILEMRRLVARQAGNRYVRRN